MDNAGLDPVWWISAVGLPGFAGLFWLVWRTRRDAEREAGALRREGEARAATLSERLAAFQVEVARTYASIPYIKDVEGRLTAHLLRIEDKLDRRPARGGEDG